MATLSSTGSGSTLSRLQSNNNPSNVHQHTTTTTSNAVSIAAVAGLGSAELIESNPKAAWSKESGRVATVGDESTKDASRHKIAVTRDTKSLDYIAKTMFAGGIAGITVSDLFFFLFYCWMFFKGKEEEWDLVQDKISG